VKSYSDAVLDPSHELGIGGCSGSGEPAPAGLSVNRQNVAEPELQTATVAPGPNRIGEFDGSSAAFHPDPDERVGHESLAQSGVDRSEHQIGIGRPHYIRRVLAR